MLVVSGKSGLTITIGEGITVVIECPNPTTRFKVAIEAPKSLTIDRSQKLMPTQRPRARGGK